MASITFNRFQADKAGYAEIMNGGSCQAIVAQKASAVKDAADGLSVSTRHKGGYSLADHEVKAYQGKLAQGRVVRTKTDRARYAQALDKTLTKALNSAR